MTVMKTPRQDSFRRYGHHPSVNPERMWRDLLADLRDYPAQWQWVRSHRANEVELRDALTSALGFRRTLRDVGALVTALSGGEPRTSLGAPPQLTRRPHGRATRNSRGKSSYLGPH